MLQIWPVLQRLKGSRVLWNNAPYRSAKNRERKALRADALVVAKATTYNDPTLLGYEISQFKSRPLDFANKDGWLRSG